MRYLTNPSTDPHFNMAFDEAVLESLPLDEPVFYLWQNRPSVIIGRNQSAYAEVNLPFLESHGITLARRVTGGGAVYHDLGNLNYTIAGRTADMDADLPRYLGLVADALRSLGVPAEVSGRNDILVEGRKCSGYAKRLSRDRMMIHGTLMFDVDLEMLTAALAVPGSKLSAAGVASVRSRVANLREYLPGMSLEDFRGAIHAFLAATPVGVVSLQVGGKNGLPCPQNNDSPAIGGKNGLPCTQSSDCRCADCEMPLPEGFLQRVEQRAAAKFRTWEWIYGESPATDFAFSRKFPSCGTVEARFSVRHGRLEGLRFGGDFLGALPAEELAASLNGTRYDAEALQARLSALPIPSYFDGLTATDLLSLLLQ